MYKDESSYYTLCKKDGRRWGYYWYDKDGKRHFRSTGRLTKHEAIKVINERIRDGELGYKASTKPIKFKEYAEPFFLYGKCRWLKEKQRTGHSVAETTLKIYRTTLDRKIIPFFGDMLVTNIDQKAIMDYENKAMEEGMMLKTIAGHIHPLKMVLDTAVKEGIIEKNPFDGMTAIKGEDSTRKAFTLEQIDKILSADWKNGLHKSIFKFACLTGMRIGEIQGLKPKHIHGNMIEVSESHSELLGKQKDTKNHKTRYTPFPEAMKEELDALCSGRGEDDLVFSEDGKKPFVRPSCTRELKETMRNVGIVDDDLTFHSARHFFDTYLYIKAGVDKEKIMKVIGHSSDTMFRHYLHIDNSDLDEIAKAQNEITK